MPSFSSNLRALRGTQKQGDFAAFLGINQATYSRYESGTRIPSGKILCRMASRLNVNVQDLLAEQAPPAPTEAKNGVIGEPALPTPSDSDGNARARGVRETPALYGADADAERLARIESAVHDLQIQIATLTTLLGAKLRPDETKREDTP